MDKQNKQGNSEKHGTKWKLVKVADLPVEAHVQEVRTQWEGSGKAKRSGV